MLLNITSCFSNIVESIQLKIFSQILFKNLSACKYLRRIFIHIFLTHLHFIFLLFRRHWSCYYELYENDALFHNCKIGKRQEWANEYLYLNHILSLIVYLPELSWASIFASGEMGKLDWMTLRFISIVKSFSV